MPSFLNLETISFIQSFWKTTFHWKLKFYYNTELSTFECSLFIRVFMENNYYAIGI